MLFSSSVFLLFFLPLLILIYYITPKKLLSVRNYVLLLFSLVFYGFGGLRYLGLLFICIGVNYISGMLLDRQEKPAWRRLILTVAMIINLGLLAWFKYAGFVAGTIALLGVPITVPSIVLPIGISFFTFQGISYTIDVYRKDVAVQRNPLNIALYISFFPQLVAGPIVRYSTVAEQIQSRDHLLEDFRKGLVRFMLGFGKKMLLANTMGLVADQAFQSADLSGFSVALAWVGAISYTFQIYFDFSGYSDMAIGLGRMFGFYFEENFRYPYIADSVTEFWHRWHISLSTWFRDYVYIPLGGSRCTAWRHVFNLMVVWCLTGLWHGANWTFIVWGLYYGVFLVLEKYPLKGVLPRVPRLLRHLCTMLIVVLGWVLFRADTIQAAAHYIGVMFGGGALISGEAIYYLREYLPEYLLCILACFPVKRAVEGFFERHMQNKAIAGLYLPGVLLFAAAVFALGYIKLVFGSFNPFIYFQF